MPPPQASCYQTRQTCHEEEKLQSDKTETSSTSDKRTANVVEEVATKAQAEKKLCKYYAQKRCRHGAKGVGCSYAHPQKCFRFMRNGSYARGGCTKGKNCDYFHPSLCRVSVRTGVCSQEDCNFHHIKGTKFMYNVQTEETSNVTIKEKQNQGKRGLVSKRPNQPHLPPKPQIQVLKRLSYANVASASISRGSRPHEGEGSSEQQANNSPNFLELNHQIQQMQFQLEKILKMNLNQMTETKICRCQAMCH